MIVYLAVNRVNQKAYVGQTRIAFHARIGNHYSVATTRNSQTAFHRALRKYGQDGFDYAILEQCDTRDAMEEAEKRWIAMLGCRQPHGYNCTDGGQGAAGAEYTAERRERIRLSQLGDRNRMKNPATARKHGDSVRGPQHPLYGKFGPSHPRYGKRFKNSEEGRLRKRMASNTPEMKERRRQWALGERNVSKRPDVRRKIGEQRRLYFLTPEGQAERLRISARMRETWKARRALKEAQP